ncbi:MAG: YqgE/AlgH family protein [Bacteroidia bacterium]
MMYKVKKLLPKQGRLLASDPFLRDPYFRRSVVLIAEHNAKGTIGFMLNKQIDMYIHEIIGDFPEFKGKVNFGGPVQRDQLFFIHTLGNKLENSIPIGKGLWWMGDFEQLKSMMEKKEVGEREIRFFIGYAGWNAGQLNEELDEHSWFVAKANDELIFPSDPDKLWEETLTSMGDHYSIVAKFPEEPSLN